MQDRLTEISKRLAAATPGPWRNRWGCDDPDDTFGSETLIDAGDGEPVVATAWYDGLHLACLEPDAAFIAHAPADIAWLLAELERERQESARLRSSNDMLCDIAADGDRDLGRALAAEVTRLRKVEAAARYLDSACAHLWPRDGMVAVRVASDALRAALGSR